MKPQHEIFVREMIRHGNKTQAYLAAFPNATGEALRTAATRLLNKPHIRQAINSILQPIREKAAAELENAASQRIKEEICSLQQRREVLAKIILGKMQVKKHIRLKDNIQEVYDDVSPYAIIRAIDLDSKLAANKYKEKIQPAEQPAQVTQPTFKNPPVNTIKTKPEQAEPRTSDSNKYIIGANRVMKKLFNEMWMLSLNCSRICPKTTSPIPDTKKAYWSIIFPKRYKHHHPKIP